jgi:hypothetical protein
VAGFFVITARKTVITKARSAALRPTFLARIRRIARDTLETIIHRHDINDQSST